MTSSPEFLTLDDILFLHAEALERYGGLDGIRDQASLEAAAATPEATFDGTYLHGDIFEKAAAYAFHIAQGQPFLDGNKRTGLAAALVFLDINGTWVDDPAGQLYDAMIAIAERRSDKRELAQVLRDLAGRQ